MTERMLQSSEKIPELENFKNDFKNLMNHVGVPLIKENGIFKAFVLEENFMCRAGNEDDLFIALRKLINQENIPIYSNEDIQKQELYQQYKTQGRLSRYEISNLLAPFGFKKPIHDQLVTNFFQQQILNKNRKEINQVVPFNEPPEITGIPAETENINESIEEIYEALKNDPGVYFYMIGGAYEGFNPVFYGIGGQFKSGSSSELKNKKVDLLHESDPRPIKDPRGDREKEILNLITQKIDPNLTHRTLIQFYGNKILPTIESYSGKTFYGLRFVGFDKVKRESNFFFSVALDENTKNKYTKMEDPKVLLEIFKNYFFTKYFPVHGIIKSDGNLVKFKAEDLELVYDDYQHLS